MNQRSGHRLFIQLIFLSLLFVPSMDYAVAGPALQEESDYAAIDDYISTQMSELGIPGVALGIIEDGQVTHLQGVGVADSSGQPVTPQTPFYIGSLTKSFTALAIMQLVEAGAIDLDAPVQNYLPWFELADQEASAKITVRHLLNQNSGISQKDGNRFWTSQQGLEEYVRELDAVQPSQPVGSTYQYSNVNYIIAGLIVEKVSGQSFSDYVAQHIFEPLDMHHSYTAHSAAEADGLADGHNFVAGYAFRDERAMPPASLPSGGLITSAEDMSHFALAQMNDGRYGDTPILSAQGIAEMHAPAVSKGGDSFFAIGWDVSTWEGIPVVSRVGDTGHFHADIIFMPDRGSGIVLLANASGFEQQTQVDQIALGLLSLLNGETPAPISVPFSYRLLYWSFLLTPLLQILGIVLVCRNRERITGLAAILIVILNLAVVFLMVALSQLIPFPLASMLVFFPDIGYALIATATLGTVWSIAFTVWYLRAWGSMPGFAASN